MSSTPLLPTPRPVSSGRARQRRVKHGVVAGYLHELTQRHTPQAARTGTVVAARTGAQPSAA